MPQVLKDEVRARILAAALEVFAARGYEGATMAAIAERAGLGTASLYRYYPGKAELFAAVITPELAEAFARLTERRVRALARAAGGEGLGSGDLGDEMLRFWIDHRLAVVILLDRAAGTEYEHFGRRFVELLVSGSLAQIRATNPGVRLRAPARFVLEQIFENTRRILAAILETHADETALREAIEAFWSYQIPGLAGLARWLGRRC
ncbi:MAG TPA: helix-turn-helix domain-containing protein [Nannocystis sp.]